MDEAELSFELLQKGDESTWTNAFRILWPCAFSAARHPAAMLTPDEAEDIACEALEILTHQVSRAKNIEELKAFLARIAYCQAISLRRKKEALKRGSNQTLSLDEMQQSSESYWEPSEKVSTLN